VVIAALVGLGPAISAQEAAQRPEGQRAAPPAPAPRSADGKPDLQGMWSARAAGATQIIEDHAEEAPFLRAGKTIVTDLADGKIPYQPWALAERDRRRQPQNNYHDPDVRCHLAGVPRVMYDMQLPIMILQSSGNIVMLHELSHATRIIAMDARPHLRATLRLWQGDSIGRWEGDTLVVETTNGNGKTWLAQYGDFVSDAAKVTERFSMVDAATINYQVTIEDQKVFTRPWTMAFALGRNPDAEMLEAACWEDNKDPQHMKDLPPSTR
jgi:hypothetical protein